jgi:signal transduction histidine kinase
MLRLWALLLLFFFSSHGALAQRSDGTFPAVTIDQPVAFCASTLRECTPDKEIPIHQKIPHDTRQLNHGLSDPITLVYKLPPSSLAHTEDMGILVSPRMRNFCFRFDVNRERTQCVSHPLGHLELESGAQKLYSEQVKSLDVRKFSPILLIGSEKSLEEQRLRERDPIMLLAGWYLLLALAAAAQMFTRRNRWASLCLVLLSLALMVRTLISGVFGFAGIMLFDAKIDRMLERLSILCICLFLTEFYASFIGDKLRKLRRAYQALLIIVGLHAIFVTQQEQVFYSIRAMQYMALLSALIVIPQVILTLKVLQYRERWVLLAGVSAITVGGVVDIYMGFSGLPFIAGIGLFPYCFAFESFCQFILIAMRNDAAHQEAIQAQQATLAAQQQAMQAQSEALLAQSAAQMQQAHNETLQAQTELTQSQLAQAEKMASLGQLIAGVTHEINTPIGAIKSSGASITEALNDAFTQLPAMLQQLDSTSSALLMDLLQQAQSPKKPLSSREERAVVKAATEKIDAAGIDEPRQKAVVLNNLNAIGQVERFLPLLQHPLSVQIFETANNVAIAISSARNINMAVDRVTKIVLALKSFSRFNQKAEKIDADLAESVETVLTIYQAQTKHGIEIVRNYEAIPLLHCLPDELVQVWTNLIHNALQAMNHEGTLTIGIRKDEDNAIVTIGDSGCGIPPENINKIFEVFFTTKPAGVGSGLGLDIVKKIIDKHQGQIAVQSEVGVGTTFTVTLPYHVTEPEAQIPDSG